MTQDNTAIALHVEERPLDEVLGEKYLSYALSTIVARSLPDVRDGLKPVHRRLLYAMRQLRLNASGAPKKSARVVGDVIGKFHPHGDVAVYDAMVRLAQSFSLRYPLVFGQGNFGSIDGDNPAAMRYTEAKMTSVAEALLLDIDKNTVDFRGTYDGSGSEPVVLPAAFPNLLANGASGIAVGMATSIPPHNVTELCDALLKLLRKPSSTVDDLLEFVQGPDFPTGGIIAEDAAAIAKAYRTGRGSFRIRARYHREDLAQGQYRIIVTEIPYGVQKDALIEKANAAIDAKKLPMVDEIDDFSAEDIRIVITPKSRNVDADVLMESVFKHTDLESRFSLNMNVLDDNGRVPKVMSLVQVLQAFLDHRHSVLVRRSENRLKQIAHRLEILEGLLTAYLNLDEVIRIIRYEDEPKVELIKAFKLTDIQAEAILNMRLKNLRKLEEMEIRTERDKLTKEQAELDALLKDESLRKAAIREEVKHIKKTFGDARRSTLADAPKPFVVPREAMIEKEAVTVVCSQKGWIRMLKGHSVEEAELKYKDGDAGAFAVKTYTTEHLLIFGSTGRFFTLEVHTLPSGRGYGEPVQLMINLPQDAQIVQMLRYDSAAELIVAAADGRGFRLRQEDVFASTKNGKRVLSLPKGVTAQVCRLLDKEDDHLAVIGENRKFLVFPLEQIPKMGKGRGVILQRYKDGGIADAKGFKLSEGLTWDAGSGRTRHEEDMRGWVGQRAGSGKMPPHGFPRSNRFSGN